MNDTDTRLELRVRYVESTVVCAEVRDRFDEVLPRDAYRPATRFIVEAGEVLPLATAKATFELVLNRSPHAAAVEQRIRAEASARRTATRALRCCGSSRVPSPACSAPPCAAR